MNGTAELDAVVKQAKSTVVMKKDALAPSRLLLARTCIELAYDGVELNANGGKWEPGDDRATFACQALLRMFGASRAVDVVTAIYSGNRPDSGAGDGEIRETANRLSEMSMPDDIWVADDDKADPTQDRWCVLKVVSGRRV
jgi:hypothetical protein